MGVSMAGHVFSHKADGSKKKPAARKRRTKAEMSVFCSQIHEYIKRNIHKTPVIRIADVAKHFNCYRTLITYALKKHRNRNFQKLRMVMLAKYRKTGKVPR